MNDPIFTVFALENGQSVQIGNATPDYQEAVNIAYYYFKETSNKVKVVKTYVQHDVVKNYAPFYCRVKYTSDGKLITNFFEDPKIFSDLISRLNSRHISYEVRFMCYSFN